MTITSNKMGLYLHVPFCRKKCRYCDFLSFECNDDSLLTEYSSALIREIQLRYREWPYRVVDSIYIGGGTPSIMPAEDMVRILSEVREHFLLDNDCEITIEANPATLTEEKLEAYLNAGINRISIGVQSFDNAILSLLGRIHDKNDAFKAIRMAKKAGFDNINIDLMFGIPGQTMKKWRDTVRQCLFLEPEHISLYSLQLEEGTPLYKMVHTQKLLTELSPETDRTMYHDALQMMESAGYEQYEISNAARPGFESRHNLKYWSYQEYLGLLRTYRTFRAESSLYDSEIVGLGAHRYLGLLLLLLEHKVERLYHVELASELLHLKLLARHIGELSLAGCDIALNLILLGPVDIHQVGHSGVDAGLLLVQL